MLMDFIAVVIIQQAMKWNVATAPSQLIEVVRSDHLIDLNII